MSSLTAETRTATISPEGDDLARQTAQAKMLIEGATFNTEDMAELLGVSLFTLRGWMAPAGTSVHREVPKTAKLLLERILADKPK